MRAFGRLLSATVLLASVASGQHRLPYLDPLLPAQQRAADLVGRMTLAEKVSQMTNAAPAIPRLGVPAYNWWSEGLHGIARSGYATVFPQAIGNAATFDAPMVGAMAAAIAVEARAKYNQAVRENLHSVYFGLTLWAPNINIFRDPRWGRGQETYGEDPFLTGQMAVQFVHGLQGNSPRYLETIATPKHFDVHSGPDPLRHAFNAPPSPHDLVDTYLPAFRAAIVDGNAGSLMCAYNSVNGVPACANAMLLQQTLRSDWHFDGFVTSDCGAIDDFYSRVGHHFAPDAAHASALALAAGTDTSCGGTFHALASAVQQGLVSESALDTALVRLFTARIRLGMFDPPDMVPYNSIPMREVNSAAHRQLALQMADKSMVLLKNADGTLPLHRDVKLAVIGPNAASLAAIEGNYNAIPSHPVLPLDGMRAEFGAASILYAQGSPYVETLPLPVPETVFGAGLSGEYFASSTMIGEPLLTRTDRSIQFDWNASSPAPGVPMQDFGVRWTGTMAVPVPGDYNFRVVLNDRNESATVTFDGQQLAVASALTLHFADTQPHRFELDYIHLSSLFGAGITLEWNPPVVAERDQAEALARQADAVVAFVGLSPRLEGEEMPVHVAGFDGGDRTDIDLPTVQRQLLQAIAATGKPLIVVLLNGSALAVNWAQQNAQAILEAWYPGEEGGTAIAETLDGGNNPAGRLPVTFYRGMDQVPPFTDYSMQGRTYRYFHGQPLYGFGYGLSYTHFAYSNLRLSSTSLAAGDMLTVTVDIRNAGSRAGDEVAELYLTPPQDGIAPLRTLQGFTRVYLQPGESRQVRFILSPRQLSLVDAQGNRAVRPGSYSIFVGGQQPAPGTGASQTLTIVGTQVLPR